MKPVVTSVFSILFFAFISSAQDNPCDAIQLECNSTALNGTFDGSTPNPEYPFDCPFDNSPGQGTVWFTFESDGSQERRIFYSDLYDTVQSRHLASIYEGNSCEELTLLEGCNRFNYFSTLLPAGTYYVQLRQRFSGPDENSYNAGLVCAPIPSNDLICNAIEVECGQVYSDQLIGSTTSFDDGIELNRPGERGDVWFKFEANSSTSYDIIGTSNQQISLFYATDTCSEILSLDFSTTNINDIVIEGTVYFSVRPFNQNPFSLTDYQVAILCSPAPEDVFICGATEISGTEGTIAGSLVEAPYDQSPCTSNSIDNSKWFKFRSDVDGELDLSACAFTIEVMSGSCEDFQCLGLDGIFCPPFSSLTVDVASDVDYFIRVSGNFDTYELNYSFSEEVFCPDLGFAGSPCDDGDPTTTEDTITPDCNCIGEQIPPGELCETAVPILTNPFFDSNAVGDFGFFEPLEFSYELDDIPPFAEEPPVMPSPQCYEQGDFVYSFTSSVDRVVSISVDGAVFGTPNATILKGCPFTTTLLANCANGAITDFYAFADTTYYLLIDGDAFSVNSSLENVYELTVTAPKACPELDGKEGDACDDGDPLTENDVITLDCECIGEVPNPIAYCTDPLNITPGPGLTASPILFDASDAVPSPLGYCDGSDEERADSWFSFEAITSNMAIGVKGVGDYDAVLEVYDACGGNRIKCRNGGEEGERETVLLLNSVIGQEYLYRVYEKGGNFSNFNSFRTSVTFFPSADIEQADCDQGTFTTSDQITATIPEFEYPVSSRTWEFTELEAPFNVYEFVVSNGSNPNIGLDQFPEIEAGRGYSVRVKPSYLNLGIDGDFGEACVISVVDPNGISSLQSEGYLAEPEYTFDMYPNPNDGNEVVVALSDLSNSQNTAIIRIYDFVGRLVMNHQVIGEGQQMTVQLPLVDLANGVYVVKITVNEKPLTAKKLVIR